VYIATVVVVRDGFRAGVVVGVAQECDGLSFLTPRTDGQVHLEAFVDTPENKIEFFYATI
jgi:hypothetical protein